MVRRVFLALGTAAVVAAVVLMVTPVGAEGVSGNAISPRYSDFGWVSYTPLPEDSTLADLRAAGVRVPHDAVAARRYEAGGAFAGGLVLLAVALLLSRPRRSEVPSGDN